MDKHVTSLEISRQLKVAGWNKETALWWVRYSDNEWGVNSRLVGFNPISAPLATEILEELPYKVENCYLVCCKAYSGFIVRYFDYEKTEIRNEKADTLPNALAKMWLYLKRNGEE